MTPSDFRLKYSVSVSAATACLDTPYGPSVPANTPKIDEVFTMCPASCSSSTGMNVAHAVHHAAQVHAEHPVPLTGRALPQRPVRPADAGVVADDVHRAERGHRGVAQRVDGRAVRHVGDHRQHRRPVARRARTPPSTARAPPRRPSRRACPRRRTARTGPARSRWPPRSPRLPCPARPGSLTLCPQEQTGRLRHRADWHVRRMSTIEVQQRLGGPLQGSATG